MESLEELNDLWGIFPHNLLIRGDNIMRTMVVKLLKTTLNEVDFANIVATVGSITWHGYTNYYIDKYENLKDHIEVYNVSELPNRYYKIDYEIT